MSVDWSKYKVMEQNNRSWPAKDEELNEGDSIEGTYVEKKTDVGPNKSNIYVLDCDGERVDVWGSTVLDAKFQDIAIGLQVAIEFVGRKKGKSPQPYKDFKVGVSDEFSGSEEGGEEIN